MLKDRKAIGYRLFRIYAKFDAAVNDNPGVDEDYWRGLVFDTYDLSLDLLGAPPEAPDAFLSAPPGLSREEKDDLMHPRAAYSHDWDDAVEVADIEAAEQSRAVFEKRWAVREVILSSKGLLLQRLGEKSETSPD